MELAAAVTDDVICRTLGQTLRLYVVLWRFAVSMWARQPYRLHTVITV